MIFPITTTLSTSSKSLGRRPCRHRQCAHQPPLDSWIFEGEPSVHARRVRWWSTWCSICGYLTVSCLSPYHRVSLSVNFVRSVCLSFFVIRFILCSACKQEKRKNAWTKQRENKTISNSYACRHIISYSHARGHINPIHAQLVHAATN